MEFSIKTMLRKLDEKALEHFGASAGKLLIARGIYQAIDWTFDNPIYAAAIFYFGPIKAFAWMTLAAAILNSCYLLIYQKTGVDWLGIGAIKKAAIATEEQELIAKIWNREFGWGWLRWPYRAFMAVPLVGAKLILWGINRGRVSTFVMLSLFQDSFVATAYFRHGKIGRLDRKDWQVFFASLIISNAYWTLRWGVIVEIVRAVWNSFS